MKLKFLSTFAILSFSLVGLKTYALEKTTNQNLYFTSDNNQLKLDDVSISLDKLGNHSYDNSQEVIDFLYNYSLSSESSINSISD